MAATGSRLVQSYPGALIDGRFLRGSGTSQAAAVVSGAAALLIDQRPELTPDQVKALLVTGAVVESQLSGGLLNLLIDSLRSALNLSLGGIHDFLTADPSEHNDPILLDALQDSVDELLSNWDGSGPGGTYYDKQSGSGMINIGKSLLLPAPSNTQDFTPSDGSGLLEDARGTHHVEMPDGSLLQGEMTFIETPWSSAAWGTWSGSAWSSASWSSGSWSSGSWSSGSWSSGSWSSGSWSSGSWSSGSWSGAGWG